MNDMQESRISYMDRRYALNVLAGFALCPLCETNGFAAEDAHWSYSGATGPSLFNRRTAIAARHRYDDQGRFAGTSNCLAQKCGHDPQQRPHYPGQFSRREYCGRRQ
jgi:hypothetical protein